jgi:hypothetical protein
MAANATGIIDLEIQVWLGRLGTKMFHQQSTRLETKLFRGSFYLV